MQKITDQSWFVELAHHIPAILSPAHQYSLQSWQHSLLGTLPSAQYQQTNSTADL